MFLLCCATGSLAPAPCCRPSPSASCLQELPAHLDHFRHVALGPGVLRGVLHFHQHDEAQVVPHVVFFLDVLFKGDSLVVELVSLQAYGETENRRP